MPAQRGSKRTYRCPADHKHNRTCYTNHGCGCETCLAACRAGQTQHRKNVAYGRRTVRVPIAKIRARLDALLADGWTWKQIGKAAGLSGDALLVMYHDTEQKWVGARIAAALLRPLERDEVEHRGYVNATGTHRRLGALVAHGWMPSELARRLGKSPDNTTDMFRGNVCTKATRAAVKALYAELWDQPAPPQWRDRARRVAARRGFVPGIAWTNIDDPAEEPWGHDPDAPAPFIGPLEEFDVRQAPMNPGQIRLQEAAHLLACGESVEHTLTVLNTTPAALEKVARRYGRLDIARIAQSEATRRRTAA